MEKTRARFLAHGHLLMQSWEARLEQSIYLFVLETSVVRNGKRLPLIRVDRSDSGIYVLFCGRWIKVNKYLLAGGAQAHHHPHQAGHHSVPWLPLLPQLPGDCSPSPLCVLVLAWVSPGPNHYQVQR